MNRRQAIAKMLAAGMVLLPSGIWAHPMHTIVNAATGGGGSASCSQEQQDTYASQIGSVNVGRYAATLFLAQQFTYAGVTGKAICSAQLELSFQGSNTRNYYVAIYASDGGTDMPTGAALGTSDEVDLSGIGGSAVDITFDFSTPSSALTNGTDYFCALCVAAADADDYARWHNHATASIIRRWDGSGETWSGSSTDKTVNLKLFST